MVVTGIDIRENVVASPGYVSFKNMLAMHRVKIWKVILVVEVHMQVCNTWNLMSF